MVNFPILDSIKFDLNLKNAILFYAYVWLLIRFGVGMLSTQWWIGRHVVHTAVDW